LAISIPIATRCEGILRNVYGNDTTLWMRRWCWFFLATAGLSGCAGGSEWASAITE
jgi:cyclopropane-fatty-acyl-phospholipid synthase